MSKGRRIISSSVFWVLLFFCLPSCSLLYPRIQEKVIVLRDTTIVHHRDSLVTRDSVYVKEWLKGDTVYLEKYRDRYVYKDRWRDSVKVVERHDTTTFEVKVEKPLSWSQKAKISLFPWLLGLSLALVVWVTKKWWLPLIK